MGDRERGRAWDFAVAAPNNALVCGYLVKRYRDLDANALVCGYLVKRYRDLDAAVTRSELTHAWDLLERTQGRFPAEALAREVGLSPHHLGTLFRREVGRSPKTVAMLMRFEHARVLVTENVRRHGRGDFTEVATAAGYSDQAHLNREFSRFTGMSPGTWLAGEF